MAAVGKVTIFVNRNLNQTSLRWSGTGTFAGLNLSQTSGQTVVSPLISAAEPDLYWAGVLDAVSAILKV